MIPADLWVEPEDAALAGVFESMRIEEAGAEGGDHFGGSEGPPTDVEGCHTILAEVSFHPFAAENDAEGPEENDY